MFWKHPYKSCIYNNSGSWKIKQIGFTEGFFKLSVVRIYWWKQNVCFVLQKKKWLNFKWTKCYYFGSVGSPYTTFYSTMSILQHVVGRTWGNSRKKLLEMFEITLFNQKSKEKVFELQVNKVVLFWVSVGVPIYYIL